MKVQRLTKAELKEYNEELPDGMDFGACWKYSIDGPEDEDGKSEELYVLRGLSKQLWEEYSLEQIDEYLEMSKRYAEKELERHWGYQFAKNQKLRERSVSKLADVRDLEKLVERVVQLEELVEELYLAAGQAKTKKMWDKHFK